jgi:hypothetical protein
MVQVAEALLEGAVTYKEIAEHVGCSPQTVGSAMREPVACAWAFKQVHRAISQRLGAIDAAMLKRALTGDVNAAKLLYSRYGQMVERHQSVNVTLAYDPRKLNNDELDTLIKTYRTVGGGEESKA